MVISYSQQLANVHMGYSCSCATSTSELRRPLKADDVKRARLTAERD